MKGKKVSVCEVTIYIFFDCDFNFFKGLEPAVWNLKRYDIC